ncbi:hypothetical protein F511_22795 [Dorcoceras hygrometricum]|uniref:Uncharacterized protein n=1 Tax=Dorcoceras hygrometricum TaxID=472368 RepID=A0A2Z7C5Y2_9LAMI|nr:hypothetical protein F511_22795 [Dorcoceras hygrometricum]
MLTWIPDVGVLARIQLLRVISCWYVSCDDQQRALRDFEAMTFCEQEPVVGFVRSSSNAYVDSRRWCISAYPAVASDQLLEAAAMLTWIPDVGVLARIQLLRVISCWYVSCDDQQRALRDFEAMTFCEQEPVVGFTSAVERSHALRLLVCGSAVGSEVTDQCCSDLIVAAVCGNYSSEAVVALHTHDHFLFSCCSLALLLLCFLTRMRGRAAIPHSHLPTGLLALMRRVVNYHSSWVGQ